MIVGDASKCDPQKHIEYGYFNANTLEFVENADVLSSMFPDTCHVVVISHIEYSQTIYAASKNPLSEVSALFLMGRAVKRGNTPIYTTANN